MIPNRQPTITDWIKTAMDGVLTEIHTCLPGYIDTFDADKQEAKVVPSIKRLTFDDKEVSIPPIVKVPVIFPSAGGYSITFPVQRGDEVLLIFSERAVDTWRKQGGVQPPPDSRKHEYMDAIAIIGLHSNPRKNSNYATDALEIKKDDGNCKIRLTADDIKCIKGDTEVTINATLVQSKIGTDSFVEQTATEFAVSVGEDTIVSLTEGQLELAIGDGGATFFSDGSVGFKNGASLTVAGDFITAGGVSLTSHTHEAPDGGGETSPPN